MSKRTSKLEQHINVILNDLICDLIVALTEQFGKKDYISIIAETIQLYPYSKQQKVKTPRILKTSGETIPRTTAYIQYCKDVRVSIKAEIANKYPDATNKERNDMVREKLTKGWKNISKTDKNDYETISNYLNHKRKSLVNAKASRR